MDARRANDRIAEKAKQLRFVSRVPMICECGAPDCRVVLLVGLDDYREIRASSELLLMAPDHHINCASLEKRMPGYDVRRLTHRRGVAGGGRRSA